MSVETLPSPETQDSPEDLLKDEVTMSANDEWLRGEVSVTEMLEDPIVRIVMERDGLDKEQVQAVFLAAAKRSKRSQKSHAKADC